MKLAERLISKYKAVNESGDSRHATNCQYITDTITKNTPLAKRIKGELEEHGVDLKNVKTVKDLAEQLAFLHSERLANLIYSKEQK